MSTHQLTCQLDLALIHAGESLSLAATIRHAVANILSQEMPWRRKS